MSKRPLYNCTVAIGGSIGHTVPKYGITAAEIAVLRMVHQGNSGGSGVYDIEPASEAVLDDNGKPSGRVRARTIDISDRDLRKQLGESYTRQGKTALKDPVGVLFPGGASRLFADVDELDLPEEAFKVKERVSSKTVAQPVVQAAAPAPESVAKPRKLTAAEKRAAEKQAAEEAAAAAEAEEDAAKDAADTDGDEDDGLSE